MAREENDREDLLREATALVERIELRIPAFAEPVVAGFRKEGAASFYFGPDCVYQFNTANEFRRGFENGQMIAAGRGNLSSLSRQRTAGATELLRREFTAEERVAYLARARERFIKFATDLETGNYAIVGQHPPEANVLERVRAWVAGLPAMITVAATPGVAIPKRK